jgi:phosphoenolpyruvate-protein kinase (PTS system EI component)
MAQGDLQDQTRVGTPYFPGVASGGLHMGPSGISPDCIALISQHQIAEVDNRPAGFIVVEAAPFSHSMIGLLGFGVPIVLANATQTAKLDAGTLVRIDGVSGDIVVNPASQSNAIEQTRPPPAPRDLATVDGEAVNLFASVRHPAAATWAAQAGAGAIGLVRTEFLLPKDQQIPTTVFCKNAFIRLCEAARPLAVTFRLLDVAADKVPPWLSGEGSIRGALGLQGVRLFSKAPINRVIEAQLTAINQLADQFNLRVLMPYLTRQEELAHWLGVVRAHLPSALPIGAMAETPAAVLDIADWLSYVDFVAIGCNDLMQSLFSADRDEPALRHYLDPYAPLLYRLLRHVAAKAGLQCHRVQLCGLLSQQQGVLPVLLGLGYRTFSVDAPFIPYLAQTVAAMSLAECRRLAEKVCSARHTCEVLEVLNLPAERHAPYLD